MNINTEGGQFGRINRAGNPSLQGVSGRGKGISPPKLDSFQISPQGKAAAEEANTTKPQNTVTPNVTVKPETGESVASSFESTTDYHNYLKENYGSISNSNIEISDKVLQQAMADPAKEKVLTDFLTEMDGAMDLRASQVEGMNDGTYKYELDNYTIKLDSIADDNSGVIGTEFIEMTVAREDGEKIGKEEFRDVKKEVRDMFDTLQEQRREQDIAFSKDLAKQLEVSRKQAEESSKERLEAKREAQEEQQEANIAKNRREAKEGQEEEATMFPSKGNFLQVDG